MNLSWLNPATWVWTVVLKLLLVLGVGALLSFGVYEIHSAFAGRIQAEKDVATLTAAVSSLQADKDGLITAAKKTAADLDALTLKNAEVIAERDASVKVVEALGKDRDKLLRSIRNSPVPEACEDQFKWLHDQADKLKDAYGR